MVHAEWLLPTENDCNTVIWQIHRLVTRYSQRYYRQLHAYKTCIVHCWFAMLGTRASWFMVNSSHPLRTSAILWFGKFTVQSQDTHRATINNCMLTNLASLTRNLECCQPEVFGDWWITLIHREQVQYCDLATPPFGHKILTAPLSTTACSQNLHS
jgi:hypothetical protein